MRRASLAVPLYFWPCGQKYNGTGTWTSSHLPGRQDSTALLHPARGAPPFLGSLQLLQSQEAPVHAGAVLEQQQQVVRAGLVLVPAAQHSSGQVILGLEDWGGRGAGAGQVAQQLEALHYTWGTGS